MTSAEGVATLSELVTLGENSSFDPTKLSTSTLKSIISHINTLKRNNISIDEQTLTINTVQLLDRLLDLKGKPLSDSYKRQIGMTIKRLYPKADISLKPYNKSHNDSRRNKSRTRISSDSFIESVRKVRDATISILQTVDIQRRIEDLGQYDACLAALLTLCTSLRIEEVRHLKMFHIDKIRNNQTIGIKSKQSYASRVIAINDLLEATFSTIERQRQYVKDNIAIKKYDHASRYQEYRLESDYIIMSTADYMRKKLHEIAASVGVNIETFGFTVFRKLTTTVLIEGGGFLTAQTMNNHSTLNTTLEHYNMQTSKSVQKTYDDLNLATSILEDVETPSAKNAQELLSKPTPKSQMLPSPTAKTTSDFIPPPLMRSVQKPSTSQPSTSSTTNNSSVLNELTEIKNQLRSQTEQNRQLQNEIDILKVEQIQTNEKATALKTKLDTLPAKYEKYLENIRAEANKKLNDDLVAAMQILEIEADRINTLRSQVVQKLDELEIRGIDRQVLDELYADFDVKLANIEKSCMNTDQLKREYDRRLQDVEESIVKARASSIDMNTFNQLVERLETTLESSIETDSSDIRRQITELTTNLENIQTLYGIDQEKDRRELEDVRSQAIISQNENEQKLKALSEELTRLRRLISKRQTVSEQENVDTRKRRRLNRQEPMPRQTLPFETPPYTPAYSFEEAPPKPINDEEMNMLTSIGIPSDSDSDL